MWYRRHRFWLGSATPIYRGLWLGLVTRFCWCTVRTAAGDGGFQRKTLRHERRSPGGSGGRRLRRFPAPSTPRLAVYYESLLLLHTHFDAELCCQFHGEFIIIAIAHGESDGGGERAGPLRARPRLALVARGVGVRAAAARRTPPPPIVLLPAAVFVCTWWFLVMHL